MQPLSNTVQRLVKEWLVSHARASLAPVVRATCALPVYSDMGGTLLIRADGEIIGVSQDGDGEPTIERDKTLRVVAVVAAAERHPELRALLPPRPENAPDCAACRGRGRLQVGATTLRCGDCGGIGWVGASV